MQFVRLLKMHPAATMHKPQCLEKGRKIVLSKDQPPSFVTFASCWCNVASSRREAWHAHSFKNTRQRSRSASCVPGVTQVPPPVEPPLRDQAQFWVVLFTCKRQEFRVSRLAIRGGLIDQTFGCKLAASAAHIDGVFVPEERIQLLVGEIPFRPLIAASFRSGRQRDGHKGARQGCQGGSGHLLGHFVPSLVFLTPKESGRQEIQAAPRKRQSGDEWVGPPSVCNQSAVENTHKFIAL